MLLRIIAVVSISSMQLGCVGILKKDIETVAINTNKNFAIVKAALENHEKRIKKLEEKTK